MAGFCLRLALSFSTVQHFAVDAFCGGACDHFILSSLFRIRLPRLSIGSPGARLNLSIDEFASRMDAMLCLC